MPKINAATLAEHRERTNEALQDAALELALDHGYEAVTMRMIADRAGVLRTAAYNYAPDKITLMMAGAERHSDEVRKVIASIAEDSVETASARLRSLILLLLVSFTQSAQQLLLLRTIHFSLADQQRQKVTAPVRDDLGLYIERILSDGVSSGEFAPIGDMSRLIRLVVAVFEAVLGEVAHNPGDVPTIANTLADFVINGLRRSAL